MENVMKTLTVNMHPTSGQIHPLVYNDVAHWDWIDQHVIIVLEDDDAEIRLNSNFVIGVVWKEMGDPEQPELWDVDGEINDND
jgi:hypothetical protein